SVSEVSRSQATSSSIGSGSATCALVWVSSMAGVTAVMRGRGVEEPEPLVRGQDDGAAGKDLPRVLVLTTVGSVVEGGLPVAAGLRWGISESLGAPIEVAVNGVKASTTAAGV